jgi:glycosyltransferase involved in cell wall biosynthesis
VVVDDGSTDETSKIATQAKAQKVIRLPVNQGVANAWNTGIHESSSDFVAVLSADDRYTSDEVLERQAMCLIQTKADFTCCTDNYQGSSFAEFWQGKRERRKKALDWLLDSHPFLAVWLNNPIAGSSVMLRRSSLDKYGYYDARLRQDADGDLWLRWLKAGAKLAITPGLGTFYTHHEGQASKQKWSWYAGIMKTRLRHL